MSLYARNESEIYLRPPDSILRIYPLFTRAEMKVVSNAKVF